MSPFQTILDIDDEIEGNAHYAGAYIRPNNNLVGIENGKNIIFITSSTFREKGNDYFITLILHEIGHTFTLPGDTVGLHESNENEDIKKNGSYIMSDPLRKYPGPNNFVSFVLFFSCASIYFGFFS